MTAKYSQNKQTLQSDLITSYDSNIIKKLDYIHLLQKLSKIDIKVTLYFELSFEFCLTN